MNVNFNQTPHHNHASEKTLSKSIASALRGKCPNCYEGNLFKTYLRQVSRCTSCHLDISSLCPDDGPAWLTIFVVGHLLIPLIFYFAMNDFSEWLSIVSLCMIASISGFIILRFSKSFFIAILWHLQEKNKNLVIDYQNTKSMKLPNIVKKE